jgi:hypothetical protein
MKSKLSESGVHANAAAVFRIGSHLCPHGFPRFWRNDKQIERKIVPRKEQATTAASPWVYHQLFYMERLRASSLYRRIERSLRNNSLGYTVLGPQGGTSDN